MNESDKLILQKRLSQLHDLQKQTEMLSMDDDQGMETGYVTEDSSINSRKDSQPKKETKTGGDDKPLVNRRKTKSERDKRRSSRVSLLDSKVDSGSENSNGSTEEKQPRYRKRAGSRRVESNDNILNSNNGGIIIEDFRRRRDGNKTVPFQQQQQQKQQITEHTEEKSAEDKRKDRASITTLKMNGKDIYFGTWNPTERAVLDQVLNNIDLRPSDSKKYSFMNKFKRMPKEKSPKQQNCNKIEETAEESQEKITAKYPMESLKYPLNQYIPNEKHIKKKFGLFKKFKGGRKKHDDEVFSEGQMSHYGVSGHYQHKKKSGLFSKLSSKPKSHDEVVSRHRAHSSNDYARCVGVHVQPSQEQQKITMPTTTNLSKSRSISTHSLRNLFSSSRTKSVDDLNGAFDFYANQKQVYQRAPSMNKLNGRATSMERLDQSKRSLSQRSLDHGFEIVKPPAKELGYEDNLVYAHAKHVQPQQANQRNLLNPPRQLSSDGYCSAYEDDYFRGYQSDWSPSPSYANTAHQHFNYDMCFSDNESFRRPHYFTPPMTGYPNFLTPNPPRRMAYQQQPTAHNNYYMHRHAPPMPGYYTPGYATPGEYMTPRGYNTPGGCTPGYMTPGQRSGYTSESENSSQYHHPPQRPFNHPVNSIVGLPQHAKRAIQRSISKTSSNYGYMSESSFCEEEEMYGMAHPQGPIRHHNLGKMPHNIKYSDNLVKNENNVTLLSTEV